MKVLVLEDEPSAARELVEALRRARPAWEVAEVLDSVETALDWFTAHPAPDLVLSDIQLSDGLSFDIFRRIESPSPIVFCTAFDEYAIRAFEQNGIDYLLKPVDPVRLERSLAKFERLRSFFSAQAEEYGRRLGSALGSLESGPRTTLLARGKDRLVPLAVAEVAWIHASGGLTTVFHGGRRHYLDETLEELESTLPSDIFRRANRQFLVARRFVAEVRPLEARKLEVRLSVEVPEPVVVSKAQAAPFLRWLREEAGSR